MDGVLVGAGSLWPVNSISPCQKPTHAVRFARESDGRHHVAISSMHRRPSNLSPPNKSPLASKRDE